MMKAIRRVLAVASLTVLAVGAAFAQSNPEPVALVWRSGPAAYGNPNQTVSVGALVTISLWATSTAAGSPTISDIAGIGAQSEWDHTGLTFASDTLYGMPNQSFNTGGHVTPGGNPTQYSDGDFGTFDFNAHITIPSGSPGLHLFDITFNAVSPGVWNVNQIASSDFNSPGGRIGDSTIIQRFANSGGNYTPDFSSVATITVTSVPEPVSLACLSIGAALLLRRRARRS